MSETEKEVDTKVEQADGTTVERSESETTTSNPPPPNRQGDEENKDS